MALGSAALAVFGTPWPAVPAAVLVAALAVGLLFGVAGRHVTAIAVLLGPVALVTLLVQGLTYPAGTTVLAAAGPLRVTVEGLAVAGQLALRVLAVGAVALLLPLTCSPHRLVTGLVQKGVPFRLGLVLALAVGSVDQLADTAGAVLSGQRGRGLRAAGVRGRLLALRTLTSAFLALVLTGLSARADVLQSRGIGAHGRPTVYAPIPETGAERWLRLTLPLCALVLVLFPLLGGGR